MSYIQMPNEFYESQTRVFMVKVHQPFPHTPNKPLIHPKGGNEHMYSLHPISPETRRNLIQSIYHIARISQIEGFVAWIIVPMITLNVHPSIVIRTVLGDIMASHKGAIQPFYEKERPFSEN